MDFTVGVTQLNEKSITYEPFSENFVALSHLFSIKLCLTMFQLRNSYVDLLGK
jgi:hypothetical protein